MVRVLGWDYMWELILWLDKESRRPNAMTLCCVQMQKRVPFAGRSHELNFTTIFTSYHQSLHIPS